MSDTCGPRRILTLSATMPGVVRGDISTRSAA
jgi:hypothetical protein